MRRKSKKTNLPRLILQWGFIAIILFLVALPFVKDDFIADFEAYCPFGGIQALSSFLLNNSLACTMTSAQIAMGVLLIIGVFLFSKLFCAFICPIGTFSEWLGSMGDKMKIRITLNGITDKIFRSLKYILLFVTFYFTLSSNELFCKKYDPYYAISTGFSMDVVLLYASIAIALVIIGSVFIRLLWCKYLCPLGAISNLFKFGWFFIATVFTYILLRKLHFNISFVWPLGFACIGGYLLEVWGEKLLFLPVARITRNEQTCTDCQLCSRKCPQAIDVASMRVVKHIDCNLCSECITVCPVNQTIQINHRSWLRWLPPVATLVLILSGLALSKVWEIPTIDQRWATSSDPTTEAVFSQSGLKNVKCYGSSMAFATKMREVKGVLGVATYVSKNKVKIYYDPTVTDAVKLQSELFTPMKSAIRTLSSGIDRVKVVSLMLDNFFDPMDFTYLSILLQEKTDAIGLESEFNCPVKVNLFFPGTTEINEQKLKEILESESMQVEAGGKIKTIDIAYKVANKMEINYITKRDYVKKMFQPYVQDFNDRAAYQEAVLDTLTIPLGVNKYNTKAFPYLISHLSNDTGVVEFKSALDSAQRIEFNIVYVDSMTNAANVMKAIKSDSLTVNYEAGQTAKVLNMFKF
jgi:polyferredoxin